MENIADRFIKMRNKLGFNKSQLAQCLQTTPSIIGEIESGKREPSKNILIKLLSGYNININWLLSGEGEMLINNPNMHAHAHLEEETNCHAHGILSNEWSGFYSKYLLEDSTDDNIPKELDLIKIENIITKPKEVAVLIPDILSRYKDKLVAVAIKGDDMTPTISENSIVLCDTLGFRGSGIYAIKINETYMAKRITIKPDYYVIASDNKLYETFEVETISDKLNIIGLVRCIINILY